MKLPNVPQSGDLAIRFWAIGLLGLLGTTWRLWTPANGLPRAPVFGSLLGVPPATDYLLLALLAFALLAASFRPARLRWLGLATLGLVGLMALDQLRWQPWAYLWMLLGTALVSLPYPAARWWLRGLLVSLYLFAAAAKLDVVFANTTGQQFVDALLGVLGLSELALPHPLRIGLALAMPVVEGAVGILLALPNTRRAGVLLAVGFHMVVAVALSPLGLGHSTGVLLWNLLSAGWVSLLFWPGHEISMESKNLNQQHPRRVASLGKILIAAAMVAPLAQPVGMWDRWPSWGLYAPRGERMEMRVHNRAAERLPPALPVENPTQGDRWRRVKIDEWVLAKTGAPIYPQNRVGLAIALALAEQGRLGGYVRVELQSTAGRTDGDREGKRLEGTDAIRNYAGQRYWLNTQARWQR